MNIFALSDNPVEAAQMLKLGHIVKMPLESAQMLCTALWAQNISAPYKPAYPKHPCTMWVQKSSENFEWLVKHSLEICKMYTQFYEKTHKSQSVIEECYNLFQPDLFNRKNITSFAQAMPEKYKVSEKIEGSLFDGVVAYRGYYYHEKVDIVPKGYPKFVPFANLVKEYNK